MFPGLPAIESAYWEIRPFVHKTPLVYSTSFSRMFGAEVWLKCENLQKTGSFKVRGSFNKLLKTGARKVTTASMGNHAQGVAYASLETGAHARIIMPRTVSIVKEEATRGYGAEVILHGETLAEALEFSMAQEGYEFVHPFDDEDVIAGQGTIGVEIAEEMRDFEAVVVPCGGGGLVAGAASAVKALVPEAKVYAVQSEAATSALESFRAGLEEPLEVEAAPTLADGIAVSRCGDKTLPLMRQNVDDFFTVPDEAIARAIHLLMERKKLVVEGAGAAPLALIAERPDLFRGRRVILVISGGNIDFGIVDRIVRRGLVANGRVGTFSVVIKDVPGSLARVTGAIARGRGNILTINHDRFAPELALGDTKVDFVVETRSKEHLKEILEEIEKEGFTR